MILRPRGKVGIAKLCKGFFFTYPKIDSEISSLVSVIYKSFINLNRILNYSNNMSNINAHS